MPHVLVKLWPGKSDDQKRRLTDAIVRSVTDTLGYGEDTLGYGEDAVSVALEEVPPAEWTTRVYEPDILARWASLTKQPGYGERPPARKDES